MKKRHALVLMLITLLIGNSQIMASPLGISLKAGSLGAGGDLTLNLGSKLNARAGINYFSYDDTVDLDEATVDGDIKLQTIPILLDWHPVESGFRVSGGILMNQNEISMSATPGDELELDGVEYIIESLDGDITFDDIAPYFGIGYGDAVSDNGRVHFMCDFGVMLHGKPKVSATATASDQRIQSRLNTDLQKEVDNLQEDLDAFVIYPVVSVGFSFAF